MVPTDAAEHTSTSCTTPGSCESASSCHRGGLAIGAEARRVSERACLILGGAVEDSARRCQVKEALKARAL
jgi:hypothetical protein